MTRLKARIVRLIEAGGPISVDQYMALCLYDPADGYYTTRDPFGAAGDFITAPEVSQMFGELVAAWLHQAWDALGRPAPFTLAEIGPGRGTLTADMLRTLGRIGGEMLDAADIALIETSPRLAEVQRETLAGAGRDIRWLETIAALPAQPLLIVGNEIFDAIPMRQFVKCGEGWRERVVTVEGADLAFSAGAGSVDTSLLPPDAHAAPIGSIVEIAPACAALMQEISERIAAQGGAGLFFDYGHLQPAVGDTFQALRRHKPEDVFAHPGEADLTSHVDFAALARVARASGLDTHTTTQGEFLLDMGLLERSGKLGVDKDESARDRIRSEAERLADPEQMGSLFKAMAILPKGVEIHPFRRPD